MNPNTPKDNNHNNDTPYSKKDGENRIVDNVELDTKIHLEVIEFMKTIGYGLMTDNKTFYELGYELDPRLVPTFSMSQAYIIHKALSKQVAKAELKARLDEQELISDFFNETGRKNLNINNRLNLFSNKMNERIEELENAQSS